MERWIIGAGVAIFVVACSSSPEPMRVCTPGSTQACLCGTSSGSQVCNGDGSAFGACMCAGVDAGMTGTDAGSMMGTDAGSTTDPLVNGCWFGASGSGDLFTYTFADGTFSNALISDVPISEPLNPGCHIEDMLTGTYVTSFGTMYSTFGPSTQVRTGCVNPADDGTAPGLRSAGSAMWPYSVSDGVLTLDGMFLNPC